jgi:hypothetical protein
MLTEKDIQEALHAHRVVPLSVANPHGPLGLEQVAAAVAALVALATNNATNSRRMSSEPLPHPLIGPGPLKGMSI